MDDTTDYKHGANTLSVANVMVINNAPSSLYTGLIGVLEHTPSRTVCIRIVRNIDAVWDHLYKYNLDELVDIFMTSYYNFPLGTWKCPDSPYGVCVYDHDADPVHDNCLVCGHPDERK